MNMTAARPGPLSRRGPAAGFQTAQPSLVVVVCSRCLPHSCHQLGNRDSGAGRLASTAPQRSRTAPSQASAPRRGRCVLRHLPDRGLRSGLRACTGRTSTSHKRSPSLDWCSPPTCAPAENSSSAFGARRDAARRPHPVLRADRDLAEVAMDIQRYRSPSILLAVDG